jgi:hypothetical protein
VSEPPAQPNVAPTSPPTQAAHLRWSQGGEATVLTLRADAIRLRSTVPSPPGSRISGTLAVEQGEVAFRIKVHGCKRQQDGSFLLEGRPLDLTRDVRAVLEKLAQS